ncbi:MAG: undecaprenyl-diphospho-oligosaccharide flippase [Verrucomicrobiaceae bacterium]|nr:undecaprenyl-diphospho-oligosaccharide flippase [Verrucomicrobiaceae bacterium]
MKEPAPQAGKLIKHSTIYAIGTLSRQLVSFLMLPVYTRFMSPADYGVVGLLTFTLALMEPFFGARLGDAIPKFYFEKGAEANRKSVLSVALTITGGISGIAALIIFLCRNPASSMLFGSEKFGLIIGLFGFQIVTQALEYYGLTFIRIQQKPLLFISVNLTKLVIQLGLNIWLIAFLKLGVMGVVISGGVSSTLYALGLTVYILYNTGYRFDFSIAKRMLIFSWPLWFSGLAGLYIWQSNRYYIRLFGSLDQVGLYELALKFAGILGFLAWSPFSQVWDVERFYYHRNERASELFGNVFRIVSVFLIIIGLGISIFADPTIKIMSALEFHKASASVPFLTVSSIFSCLIMFMNFSFLVSGNTKQITFNNYITMAAITALNLTLIPKFGEIGAAIALMFAMILQFFMTEKIAKKNFDMQIKISPLLLSLAVGAIGYVLAVYGVTFKTLWLDLFAKTIVYFIFVFILAGVLWRDPNSRFYISKITGPIVKRLLRR